GTPRQTGPDAEAATRCRAGFEGAAQRLRPAPHPRQPGPFFGLAADPVVDYFDLDAVGVPETDPGGTGFRMPRYVGKSFLDDPVGSLADRRRHLPRLPSPFERHQEATGLHPGDQLPEVGQPGG